METTEEHGCVPKVHPEMPVEIVGHIERMVAEFSGLGGAMDLQRGIVVRKHVHDVNFVSFVALRGGHIDEEWKEEQCEQHFCQYGLGVLNACMVDLYIL